MSLSLLERVLDINKCFPVKESEKFTVTSAAEKLLAEYHQEPEPSPELTYAVIRLYRYLKKPAKAYELMVQRRPVIESLAREIDFYEMELHFACGSRAVAEELLEKLMAGGKLRPSWKRAIDKIRLRFESEGAWDELSALEQGLAEGSFGVDLATHLPQLASVLRGDNEALEVLLFVQDRLRALQAIQAAAPRLDPTPFDKYHVGHLIFSCGFSWSGSGAVSCFLAQHKAVSQPFGMSELGYVQGRSGRKGIFPFIEEGPFAFGDMKKLLASFCLESIVCLRAIKHHYSLLMQCSRSAGGRVPVLGQLLDDFHRMMLSQPALDDVETRKRIVARFLQRLFSVKGGTNILLNNVFMAPRIELAAYMEDALFIAVERDARDQFIARKTESRDAGHQNLQEFAAMLAKGRAKFQRISESMSLAEREKRLLVLRFDAFVRDDDSVRDQLLERLGLPKADLVPDLERFDPSVSIKNVGIHAGQLTEDELAWVDRELGVYMR